MRPDYPTAAEEHAARAGSPLAAVGVADHARFARLGRIQLALLKEEGLEPHHRLLEFGCNIGRLAIHAVPYLANGRYVGLDFAPSLVDQAQGMADALFAAIDPACYAFASDDGEHLARWGTDYDFACAFSVFPHMEHEDTLRLLRQFAGVLVDGGRLVCSVLALETDLGKTTMLAEADIPPTHRFNRLRNVATTYSLMESLAWLAGFQNFRWYQGDVFKVPLDDGTLDGFRQSVLAAERG